MIQLNFSEELHDNILSSVHCALIITDPQGVVLWANSRVRDVFGYAPQGLKEKNISILFTPEDQKYLYPNYLYLAGKCKTLEDEIMLLRRNKARFYADVKLLGIRNQDQSVNIFSILDIDKAKKMEKVFHQISYNDLLKLANGMAHEIRNPLMGISAFLRKLHKSCSVTGKDEEYYNQIHSHLKKIESIVGKVDFFASMPDPVLVPASLSEIMEEVMADYEECVKSGKYNVRLEITDTRIMADPQLLKRAMGTLLDNSLDACSDASEIFIRAGLENSSCRIMVKDNGRGISAEELPYIFHPFYSTKPDGAGIDLAIFKRIIEGHHGQIHVDSKKGRGTTFYIDLPLERRKKIRTDLLSDSNNEMNTVGD
ncbi:MAG: two-component system sensor histidine kinase NtrB [Desulfonatronovibrio sp.]